MGLKPSCVKTAPGKVVAEQLFMITEQVIRICILTSVFDTSLNSFSRFSLLKAASCCLVCSPHRLHFRASSAEAGVWWGKTVGEPRDYLQCMIKVTAIPKDAHVSSSLFVFDTYNSSLLLLSHLLRNLPSKCLAIKWFLCIIILCLASLHCSELAALKLVPCCLYPS